MFLRLDQQGPLYAQVYRALRAEILSGRLAAGTCLPATRSLASDLGVSRNAVVPAYEQLIAEGYVTTRRGAGTFVATELPEAMTTVARASGTPVPCARPKPTVLSSYARRMLGGSGELGFTWTPPRPQLPYDFRYGWSSLGDFPHSTWCRLLARRARRASTRDLDYGPPEGSHVLREAIADYLRRARAISCAADQVLVVDGSQQALDLTARVLIDVGDRVLLEEPHYWPARAALMAAGAAIATIPVDEHGLRVREIGARGRCRLVYVTPSHQFPTGAVMPLARRLELLAWTDRSGAFVFEDDYDSEYRFAERPIEALQGLDRTGRVLYAGTFSKLMFPGLRLGYLVLPEQLVAAFRTAKALADTGSATLPQLALADFIREGHFEQHLRRSRRRNAVRRAALLEAIERHLGERVEVCGSGGGLHVLLWLAHAPFRRIPTILRRAEEAGVGVYSVGPFYTSPPPRAGLLLGYGSLAEKEIAEGMRRLASILN